MTPVRVLQFARAPVPGAVKTRLFPALGAERACRLHCRLVEHTTTQLAGLPAIQLALYCDDTDHDWVRAHAQRFGIGLHAQVAGDLGTRMLAACQDAPDEAAILVGSDCPALNGAYLQAAIDALAHSDVVIGPASDGGYVLLGTRRPQPTLFTDIDWGSNRVLAQTLARAEAARLKVLQLTVLDDIDRPEDLDQLARFGIDTD